MPTFRSEMLQIDVANVIFSGLSFAFLSRLRREEPASEPWNEFRIWRLKDGGPSTWSAAALSDGGARRLAEEQSAALSIPQLPSASSEFSTQFFCG